MQHTILSQHYLKGIYTIQCINLVLAKKPSCYIALSSVMLIFLQISFAVLVFDVWDFFIQTVSLYYSFLHGRPVLAYIPHFFPLNL
jgi:hypothetical protein